MQASAKARSTPAYRLSQGFTLIEVLVVVIIIGFLASIALPQYNDYTKRGRAAEAINTLTAARIRMEQYYQDARGYDPAVTGVPHPAGTCPPAATDNFTYSCNGLSATTYLLTATGKAATGMNNFSFTINAAGTRTSNYDGTAGASCWLTRKGGSCT